MVHPFLRLFENNVVTIRLAPLLPTTVAVVHFPDVQEATEAVMDVMQTGVGIRTLSYPFIFCSFYLKSFIFLSRVRRAS